MLQGLTTQPDTWMHRKYRSTACDSVGNFMSHQDNNRVLAMFITCSVSLWLCYLHFFFNAPCVVKLVTMFSWLACFICLLVFSSHQACWALMDTTLCFYSPDLQGLCSKKGKKKDLRTPHLHATPLVFVISLVFAIAHTTASLVRSDP